MNKSELKTGMIVEYRNGEKRLVVNDILMGESSGMYLKYYTDDLMCYTSHNLDIMRVYEDKHELSYNTSVNTKYRIPIWTRKTKISLKNISKDLGYKVSETYCDIYFKNGDIVESNKHNYIVIYINGSPFLIGCSECVQLNRGDITRVYRPSTIKSMSEAVAPQKKEDLIWMKVSYDELCKLTNNIPGEVEFV